MLNTEFLASFLGWLCWWSSFSFSRSVERFEEFSNFSILSDCNWSLSISPKPWTFHCLVTKKSADVQSPKSLYLSHNKYVKPINIFKARLRGKIMGTKVGKKQWSSSTYLMIHNKTTVGGFWLAAFVMGQI